MNNLNASLVDGRCSICLECELESTVTMNSAVTTTLLACGCGSVNYDKHGNKIMKGCPKPNTATRTGKCSRGHTVVEQWRCH